MPKTEHKIAQTRGITMMLAGGERKRMQMIEKNDRRRTARALQSSKQVKEKDKECKRERKREGEKGGERVEEKTREGSEEDC